MSKNPQCDLLSGHVLSRDLDFSARLDELFSDIVVRSPYLGQEVAPAIFVENQFRRFLNLAGFKHRPVS